MRKFIKLVVMGIFFGMLSMNFSSYATITVVNNCEASKDNETGNRASVQGIPRGLLFKTKCLYWSDIKTIDYGHTNTFGGKKVSKHCNYHLWSGAVVSIHSVLLRKHQTDDALVTIEDGSSATGCVIAIQYQ